MKPSKPSRARSPARHRHSASPRLRPGSEVRNAAAAPHLRVVAAAPNAACQGQPAARPRPARPPSPGRPHFRPSGQSRSPGHRGDASRTVAPSRTEVGPQSPSALVRTGWLCSPGKSRPRQTGPCPARGRSPSNSAGYGAPQRPNRAESLRPGILVLDGVVSVPWLCSMPDPHNPPNFLQRKSTPFHLPSTTCLPRILLSSKRVLYLVSLLKSKPVSGSPQIYHSSTFAS